MKILVDSSVLLSIYLEDSNKVIALKMIKDNILADTTLILPEIVVYEVINGVCRRKGNLSHLHNLLLNISLSDRFQVVTMKRDWLIKKIYQYSQISNLKTNDLIIYLATRKYKVDKLLTLDKKLQAFNSLNYDKD